MKPISRALDVARAQPLAVTGLVLLVGFLVCALFAPWLAPSDPAGLDLAGRLVGPSAGHWFGTDELGRDILSRTIFGARISMVVAVSVVSISLSLGLVAGGLAGFYGGWTDTFVNVYVTNAFLALPGILIAIAFVAFLGPGLGNLIVALSLSGWVGYARLVRAQVMAVKEREFVEAARALGASDFAGDGKAYSAEYCAAADCAGGDRDGGGGVGGGYAEFPGARDSGSGGELGGDAQ